MHPASSTRPRSSSPMSAPCSSHPAPVRLCSTLPCFGATQPRPGAGALLALPCPGASAACSSLALRARASEDFWHDLFSSREGATGSAQLGSRRRHRTTRSQPSSSSRSRIARHHLMTRQLSPLSSFTVANGGILQNFHLETSTPIVRALTGSCVIPIPRA